MKKGGFTKIDNKLLESIICAGLNATELCVLFAIIRYINGYQRMTCDMSFSRFAKLTKKDKRTVVRAINSLRKKGFISRKTNGVSSNTYILVPRCEKYDTSVDKINPQV